MLRFALFIWNNNEEHASCCFDINTINTSRKSSRLAGSGSRYWFKAILRRVPLVWETWKPWAWALSKKKLSKKKRFLSKKKHFCHRKPIRTDHLKPSDPIAAPDPVTKKQKLYTTAVQQCLQLFSSSIICSLSWSKNQGSDQGFYHRLIHT